MIGTRTDVQFSEGEVNWAMIKYFCSATEDANASYWDPEFARDAWAGVISPPALLVHWLLPAPWRPGQQSGGQIVAPVLGTSVPLPGDTVINVSTEYEYRRPIRVGDRLTMVEELTDVSPEKTTRLGVGHFVTTLATYRDQHGEVVALHTNTLLRFTSPSDERDEQR